MQRRGGLPVVDSHQPGLRHSSREAVGPPSQLKRGERYWHTACPSPHLRLPVRLRKRTLLVILFVAVGLSVLFLLSVSRVVHLLVLSDNDGRDEELSFLQRSLFFEDETHSASLLSELNSEGDVCAVCAEGHILFRSTSGSKANTDFIPEATSVVSATPFIQSFEVCTESVEEEHAKRASMEHSYTPLPLSTARDCVARLYNLGLLAPPRATTTPGRRNTCVQLRVAVQMLKKTAVITSVEGQCSAVVAQLRRSSMKGKGTGGVPMVELATPRLTVWPVNYTESLNNSVDELLHENRQGSRGSTTPPYFGTAAVKDADVDRDVPPPTITLTNTRDAIVVRFDPLSTTAKGVTTETAVASPELYCPLHFFTVRLGRFGRHHNQLQELLNGIALATQLNRTFILPPFVPTLYTGFLKLDTEIFYGWHTMREKGRYCLLTYAEARPLLRQAYASSDAAATTAAKTWEKLTMSMTRVHLLFDPAAHAKMSLMSTREQEWHTWGDLPRLPSNDTTEGSLSASPLYDADEWFACGVHAPQDAQALLLSYKGEATRLRFREVFIPTVHTEVSLDGGSNHPTCWEQYRAAVKSLVTLFGSANRRRGGDNKNGVSTQPDLVVISSATAFHVRPRLTEMSRLLGLLRPSPYVISEIGRFYRLWAPQYQWPAYTNPQRTFDDCLQPSRFKGVVGIHVRRRELTCRQEAEHLSQTILSLTDGRYVLDGTGHTRGGDFSRPAPANSTVARLVNDCLWDARSLVHIFRQYSNWMTEERKRKDQALVVTGTVAAGRMERRSAHPRYTSYIACDEQTGPIGKQMEVVLQRNYTPAANEVLADGTRPSFTAVYDRRLRVDFRAAYYRAVKRVRGTEALPANMSVVNAMTTRELNRLVELVYPLAEQELMGMAFDFFMLSNTEVFRGNVISSVSVNVCVRRWGRGLPCHGVAPGYYETLYKGFP